MDLANTYKVSSIQRSPQTDDKVVSLTTSMFQDVTSASANASPARPAQRDYSGSLQIVQEVVEAMRISDARVSELEAELQRFADQAGEEINRLKAQLDHRDGELQAAQQRLRDTEDRAAQAEAGLTKLNDAIKGSLAPLLREFEARKQSSFSSAS